jgi:hypothetical protein
METTLLTLSKIFTERLSRIPDYQRGYAWTEKQLKDFWSDLEQLEIGKNHYVGVLNGLMRRVSTNGMMINGLLNLRNMSHITLLMDNKD